MRKINADIKNGTFEKVYLLLGEEEYLKRQFKNKIKKALVADNDTMNYSYFDGNKMSVDELIGSAMMVPFFAEKRVIIVDNSKLFVSSKETDNSKSAELAECIENLPDTTCIVFIEDTGDKRTKLYKAVSENGYVCELAKQDESSMVKWIQSMFKQAGKTIEAKDARLLVSRCGSSMDNVENEVNKLIAFSYDKEVIELSDIENICTEDVESKVFAMIDAMTSQAPDKAFKMYYDLLALREEPIKVYYLIVRHFTILVQIKDMLNKGMDKKSVCERAKIREGFFYKYTDQCKKYTMEGLTGILNECAELEQGIKTGLDSNIAVEMLMSLVANKMAV